MPTKCMPVSSIKTVKSTCTATSRPGRPINSSPPSSPLAQTSSLAVNLLQLVLALGPLRRSKDSLRAGPRVVSESHPRRQSQNDKLDSENSLCCCAAETSPPLMPIPPNCGPPAICSDAGLTWFACEPRCSRMFRSSIINTTTKPSRRRSATNPIARVSPIASTSSVKASVELDLEYCGTTTNRSQAGIIP